MMKMEQAQTYDSPRFHPIRDRRRVMLEEMRRARLRLDRSQAANTEKLKLKRGQGLAEINRSCEVTEGIKLLLNTSSSNP